jgi:hypothetical protein
MKIMTTNEQLELGFNGLPSRARGGRHEQRLARADWWFGQMRRIVASAMDWQAAGQPPSGQSWLSNPRSK